MTAGRSQRKGSTSSHHTACTDGGFADVAARLAKSGADGHPGLDEIQFIAKYLGGQVLIIKEADNAEEFQIIEGAGPLVASFRHTNAMLA